jgi:tetratricopeptide (TPR) repeat protein
VKAHVHESQFANWVSLFALVVVIVHGSIYDYLYNGSSTLLMFFPMGMAISGAANPVPGSETTGQRSKTVLGFSSANLVIVFLGIFVLLMLNFNKVVSQWYSNLGAVQMSQVELENFPTNEWSHSQIIPQLETADASFRSAIQYYPYNQTANYRLGLISMLRQDFRSAVINLEIAHQRSPDHRGIIKNLGYCYVWLGDMDKALQLLRMIPEAQTELDAYTWWWNAQGRQDLSKNAIQFSSLSEGSNYQP